MGWHSSHTGSTPLCDISREYSQVGRDPAPGSSLFQQSYGHSLGSSHSSRQAVVHIPSVSPACLFLNRMLDTLRQCPEQGFSTLSPEFRKDLAWFDRFLPNTDGTFIIHQDDRHMVQLYSMSNCRALTADRAYHATFPPRVLRDNNPLICHLEALNATLGLGENFGGGT